MNKKSFILALSTLLFLCFGIVFLVLTLWEFRIFLIVLSIIMFVSFAITLRITLLELSKFPKYTFFISYNHTYFFNEENIFANAEILKSGKVWKYRRFLKNKLASNDYKKAFIKRLDLTFLFYELKDNYQLIIFSNKELYELFFIFDSDDMELNAKYLIKILGIPPFNLEEGEVYESLDKRTVLLLKKTESAYSLKEYHYTISNAYKIKNSFKKTLPHWRFKKEVFCGSLEEAQVLIHKRLD